jgi:superfamily II DNA or RNA helicase
MAALGTLHDQVSPSHQKVGGELRTGKNETQLHRDTQRYFSMLTRTGYVTPPNPELKRELTVRAIENALGMRPPPFKVFKETTKHLCMPRFFGEEKLGPARDTRPDPIAVNIPFTGSLRGIQTEAIDAYKGHGVLSLDVGFGKCLGRDTPVMMYDGTIRMVQDIQVGEYIMGDDSTPRTVLSTCSGTEQMYRVVPTKGDPYVVNESHILSLKLSTNDAKKNGQVVDISVKDFLNLPPGPRRNMKGYRVPIHFEEKEVPFDPYMFGYWLGDGAARQSVITSQDSTVLHYFSRNLGEYGMFLSYVSQYDYRMIAMKKPNYFYKTMNDLGVIQNKHVPRVYKCNSRRIQLALLAGFIDADGSGLSGGWDVVQKNERLLDDIMFIARSLGFACYKQKCTKVCTNSKGGPKAGTYYRCTISGKGVEEVPCKIRRKIIEPRRQKKDVLNTGIHLEKLEVGEYFGFEIDGNRRFVLGDFTVTHNTVCALAIAARMGVRTMIIVHKEFLANQWAERIEQFCPGCTIGRVQQDRCELDHPFVIGMIQTLCMRGHAVGTFDSVGLVIVDEAHHVGAPAFSQAMFTMCPKYTLGLTATPDRKDGLTRVLYWFLGNCFYAAHRQSSKNVRVKRIPFIHPEFLKAPPVSRLGKVCLATMVNTLVEIPERNELLLDIAREAATDHQVLILSDRRAHCEWLVRELGETAGLYMGGMKQEHLDASAKKRIVVGTFSLAHEGLDIATLSAIVLATPHSDVRQAVGRILRTEGPKVIYDMADTWSVMNAMFRKRAKIYADCGFQMDQVPREEEPETASIFQQGKCLL